MKATNQFDFVRFLLAASVCFTHSFNLLLGEGTDPVELATHGLIGGGMAVNFFFVISGYLVTASLERSSGPLEFMKKRALRIYPGFLVVTLICGFIVGPLGSLDWTRYLSELSPWVLVKRALLLQLPATPATFDGLPFPMTNGSLWTIKYEFACYLTLALCGVGFLRMRAVVLTLWGGCLAILFLQRLMTSVGPDPLATVRIPEILGRATDWPRFASFFLSGVVFRVYRLQYSRPLFIVSLATIAASLTHPLALTLAMPTAGAYALLYIATRGGFSNFGKYGDFSYGVYLYAWPVQILLVMYLGAYLSGWTMFLVSLPLASACAFLSWRFIENPALSLKRSLVHDVDGPSVERIGAVRRGDAHPI